MSFYFLSVASFISLLLVSSIIYIVAKKINFPYTIALVGIGILLGILTEIFPSIGFLTTFQLTPETLLYIFLPILLFESAYNMNFRELMQNSKSIGLLATVSLLISAFLIAGGLWYVLGLFGITVPFIALLLFGALISATDPVSVLALFKEMGAPRRLTLIFEGESLFNDGTALALFLVILGVAFPGGAGEESLFANMITGLEPIFGSSFLYVEGFISFLLMIIVGILLGWMIGFGFSRLIPLVRTSKLLEVSLTLIVAHATFLIAEWVDHSFLPVSAVIATTISALVIGNYGKYKLSPKTRHMMNEYWEFFAHIANSLVFLLVGIMIVNLNIHYQELFIPILLAIFVVIVARAISVYSVLFPLNWLGIERYIPLSWMHILSWGSLRGALAVIMALFVPLDATLPGWTLQTSVHDFILGLTVGCIIFTTFVKATTIPSLLQKLGITALSSEEHIDYIEAKILFSIELLGRIEKVASRGFMNEDERKKLTHLFEEELSLSEKELLELKDQDPEMTEKLLHKILSLHALEIERVVLFDLFNHEEMNEFTFRYMLDKFDSQIARIEEGKTQIKDAVEHIQKPDILTRCIRAIHTRSLDEKEKTKELYTKVRTRQILTEKVLKRLKLFHHVKALSDSSALDQISTLYEELREKAHAIRTELLKETYIQEYERELVGKMLFASETDIIEHFIEQGIISAKSAKLLEGKFCQCQ